MRNFAADSPEWMPIVAGSRKNGYELANWMSVVRESGVPSNRTSHSACVPVSKWLALQTIDRSCVAEDRPPEFRVVDSNVDCGDGMMISANAFWEPLYETVMTIHPVEAASAVALKLALEVPWATLTAAGTASAELVLVTPTDRFPAADDSETVQLAVAPTAILVGVQAREDRVGVDQSGTVVFCEDAPRVAVTIAWLFEEIVPAVAVTLPVALPDGMIIIAGMGSSAELELSETIVLVETS
jgi:hypothetical protein